MFSDATAGWIKEVLGAGVMTVGEMGSSEGSSVFRVELIDNRSVVLRLRADPECQLIENEAWALRTLVGSGLPVPELLGLDDGGVAGAPALLMSWLPGQVDPQPEPGALARLLHDVQAATRSGGTVLVHGAFEPSNVLWVSGAPTGLLDWGRAVRGSPEVDVESGAQALGHRSGEGFRAAYAGGTPH